MSNLNSKPANEPQLVHELVPRLAYSVEQAARLVSISRRQLYEEIGSGRLLTRKVGKRRLVLSEDLKSWLRSRPSG